MGGSGSGWRDGTRGKRDRGNNDHVGGNEGKHTLPLSLPHTHSHTHTVEIFVYRELRMKMNIWESEMVCRTDIVVSNRVLDRCGKLVMLCQVANEETQKSQVLWC